MNAGETSAAPYSSEFLIVLLMCAALGAGALIRLFAGHLRVSYTVVMLLVGLGAGLAIGATNDASPGAAVAQALSQGSAVSPELIIFVFLPALVFESAFTLDIHAFRKNIGALVLLAAPGFIITTLATGALVFALTAHSWAWSLSTALVFGVLISATDPVAVVAILREIGGPRRLRILIEGESLLNDGTAIVLFGFLIMLLLGSSWENVNLGHHLLAFAWVVGAGVAVGLVLSYVASMVTARTFNDPMVEITITLILAYGCMLAAEGLLHVSGIMAVVTAGLWMGGAGRARISPEVYQFLGQFWAMLGYIANTLIFFLVGLVIAAQFDKADLNDLSLIIVTYLGVMAIRSVVTFCFRPLIALVSAPIDKAAAVVISWSGIRGAVSLALALIISQNQAIDPLIRQQVLLLTSGVVLLSILLNGSTSGALLRLLGLAKAPAAEQIAEVVASEAVLSSVRGRIEQVSSSRDLRTVSWEEVDKQLARRSALLRLEREALLKALQHVKGPERTTSFWRQVLRIERQAYWSALALGTLSPVAVRILDREIYAHLDRLAHGRLVPPETRCPLHRVVLGKGRPRKIATLLYTVEFDHLSLLYELSRAETLGAEKVLSSLDMLGAKEPRLVEIVRETYETFLRLGKERIEDLRTTLPEITGAIETRLAKRIQLNFEREGWEELLREGVLDEDAVNAALADVERQMKQLGRGTHRIPLPETAELVRQAPLFANLDGATLSDLATITEEKLLSPGETLFQEGDRGDALFVIARGALHVVKNINGQETIVDVVGGGDIVGEIALLSGAPRTTTIRAATTVIFGKISRVSFEQVMRMRPGFRDAVWSAFTAHRFNDCLRNDPRYLDLTAQMRARWLSVSRLVELSAAELLDPQSAAYVFVVWGEIRRGAAAHQANSMFGVVPGESLRATAPALVVLLPKLDEVLASVHGEGEPAERAVFSLQRRIDYGT